MIIDIFLGNLEALYPLHNEKAPAAVRQRGLEILTLLTNKN